MAAEAQALEYARSVKAKADVRDKWKSSMAGIGRAVQVDPIRPELKARLVSTLDT